MSAEWTEARAAARMAALVAQEDEELDDGPPVVRSCPCDDPDCGYSEDTSFAVKLRDRYGEKQTP